MLLIYMICLTAFISTVIKNKKDCWLVSIVVWTATSYGINEALSIGNYLDRVHLMGVYAGLIILMAVLLVYQRVKNRFPIIPNITSYKQRKRSERFLPLILGVFLLGMLCVSIITIPYDIDSLTYHLTRIAYWTQNKSVAHFATNDVRAVTSPPLAEFINLQVYILHNQSDKLMNVLQASSFITNTLLVLGISKKLKLEKMYQYLSVLLFVSTPIAFGEALTTQVDQFAALWTLLFVYFLLDLLDESFKFTISKEVIGRVLLLGACIAFGYLTKPTGLFAVLVFAVLLLVVCIRRKDKVTVLLPLIMIAAVEIVVILAPELLRNIATFNAISASSVGNKHMVDTLHPLYLLLNFMKNISVNTPNIYIPWISKIVKFGVCFIANKVGIDINDPAIAHDGAEYLLREPQRYIMDSAINPIVFYLSVMTAFWIIMKLIKREKTEIKDYYTITAIASFLLFCAVLKYELYSVRYMIPYLALMCPAISACIMRMKIKSRNAIIPIIIFVCIVELLGLFKYHGQICVKHMFAEDRMTGYFERREKDLASYQMLDEFLEDKEFDSLGIYLSWGAGEYPIWKMVDENVRIEAVNVNNETVVYADNNFIPEYIVVKGTKGEEIEDYKNCQYVLEEVFDEKIYIYGLSE